MIQFVNNLNLINLDLVFLYEKVTSAKNIVP